MEQTNATNETTSQRPGFLSTLCILSFIGSGLWALLSLIGIFASGWIISMFMGQATSAAMDQVDTSGMTSEQIAAMEATTQAVSGGASMIGTYAVIIFVVSLLLAGLSIFGVAKMWKLKKSGFWFYSVINGLIAILALIGGSFFSGIVGVAFIVMYGLNLKHMK
jgi:hypothetical protein